MITYKPNFIPNKIFVIGAGGTGSRLIPPLAQLVRTCLKSYNPLSWIEKLPIYIFDGDVVEEKNLARQNFIQKDVGKNKAIVLASRYSPAFGIPITAVPHFVVSEPNHVYKDCAGEENSLVIDWSYSIVILAVDSADARRTIIKNIIMSSSQRANVCVIDAGNEDTFGQVSIATFPTAIATKHINPVREYLADMPRDIDLALKGHKKLPHSTILPLEIGSIPLDLLGYLSRGESAQEKSCANLPQTLAINTMMATLILSIVQNFLYLQPFSYSQINFSLSTGVSTEPLTVRNINKVLIANRLVHDFVADRIRICRLKVEELNQTLEKAGWTGSPLAIHPIDFIPINAAQLIGRCVDLDFSTSILSYLNKHEKELKKLKLKISDDGLIVPDIPEVVPPLITIKNESSSGKGGASDDSNTATEGKLKDEDKPPLIKKKSRMSTKNPVILPAPSEDQLNQLNQLLTSADNLADAASRMPAVDVASDT